jgi:hypothetical protein
MLPIDVESAALAGSVVIERLGNIRQDAEGAPMGAIGNYQRYRPVLSERLSLTGVIEIEFWLS